MSESNQHKPVVAVVGDGWAALGAAGFLGHAGMDVRWISATGSRALAPLSSFEIGPGAQVWVQLAARLGIDAGKLQTGSFLREFRNKSFRPPLWNKAPTPEARRDVRDESLWAPESRFAPAFECRLQSSLADLEEEIRKAVIALPNVKRIDGVPVNAVELGQMGVLTLGSGEKLTCDGIIYADRWAELSKIEGLPKALPFTRNREPHGILQAVFTHTQNMTSQDADHAFFGVSPREAGEEFQRSVFGYFFDQGRKSVWSLFLAPDEVEDNHMIAKKLRRMKQTLDKMFTGPEWLPEGKADFISTVENESVRLIESYVFASGNAPVEPIHLSKSKLISFLTDGYGPTNAMQQVGVLLSSELGIDLTDPDVYETQSTVAPASETQEEPPAEPDQS